MNITFNELHTAMTQGCTTNEGVCPCRGRGWMLSDYDTWHECPSHPGRLHPENEMTRVPTLRVRGTAGSVRFEPSRLDVARREARRIANVIGESEVSLRWEDLGYSV